VDKQAELEHAYQMGYDCGKNGPNTTNCHFVIFSRSEKTRAWERGKRDAEKARPAQLKQHRAQEAR